MLFITKGEEPEVLREYKRKYPNAKYSDASFAEFRQELNQVLRTEQKHLCAYCCGKIDAENSHNEHIEPQNPKGGVSDRSLEYTNIVASCNGLGSGRNCGEHKKNEYDESRFVSPLNSSCEDIFSYYPNGTISGDSYTIELLNLNSYALKEARAAVYKVIKNMSKEDICLIYDAQGEELQPFYNVVKWFLKENL